MYSDATTQGLRWVGRRAERRGLIQVPAEPIVLRAEGSGQTMRCDAADLIRTRTFHQGASDQRSTTMSQEQ